LQGIVAQRLVRRVCESCAEPFELSPGQTAWLKAQVGSMKAMKTEFLRGRGCNYCQLTGYRGRIGVYELLDMDNGLTDALRREDLSAFVKLAHEKDSYVPLVNCALDYAKAGVTSIDEVIRVAGGLDGNDDFRIDETTIAASETADG